jgi:clan AA aspartic protease (TIGR02281 family)
MITAKDKKMGRFSVEIEVANYDDLVSAKRGHLAPDQVRRVTIRGVVDCGASRLVLPGPVAKQLGLEVKRKVRVKYANGQRALRPEVAGVHLTLQGRDDVFSAVVEPKRDSALIGAIVLEDLDFLVDSTKMRLLPRDPDYIFSEIE